MTPLKAVHLAIIEAVFRNMVNRVTYGMGEKADEEGRQLDTDSHEVDDIDCSGFVRYAIYRASNKELRLPDGSQAQLEWAETHLRKLAKYSDVVNAKDDPHRLFIAFLRVTKKRNVGHVWLLRADGKGNMKTLESHGGVGVDSRAWNVSALKSCTDCFEIPAML